MKAYTVPALAFLAAATCAGAAHARVQNGLDGLPSGNPTGSDNCYDSSVGSVRNKCGGAPGFSLGWYIPLVIDTTGFKLPVVNARGPSGGGEFPSDPTKCRGYVVLPDGSLGGANAWQIFNTNVDQEKTLGALSVGANSTYLVGCYIGGFGQVNTVRYTQ